MKAWQSLAVAAATVVGVNAQAAGIQEFIGSSHDSAAPYSYVETNLLIHPDDYKGFGLQGSYVIRPNMALVGHYNRLTADVVNVDVTSTLISVGGRYFFGLSSLANTDLDLTAYLTRAEAEAGSLSISDSGFVLGGQLRHMLGDLPIGTSIFTAEEVYGGLRMGFSDGDSNAVAQVGLIVGINEQFSAKAEVALDDGTHFSVGVRMQLGKKQINPDAPLKSALSFAPTRKPVEPPQVSDSGNPYGLTADELADLEEIAGNS